MIIFEDRCHSLYKYFSCCIFNCSPNVPVIKYPLSPHQRPGLRSEAPHSFDWTDRRWRLHPGPHAPKHTLCATLGHQARHTPPCPHQDLAITIKSDHQLMRRAARRKLSAISTMHEPWTILHSTLHITRHWHCYQLSFNTYT